MLRENFKALGAVVGGGLINAFKPFIKVLNAVLQKVISFAEMVTNALGSIFGWKYEASKGAGISGLADDIGSASDGMDDLSDAAGSAGKNTGGIAKNAKKAKKEIQQATRAFDELKVISKQSKDNTSGSGSGGSGGGSGSGGSGGGDTGKLVQTDTIFKKFESDIEDLEGLGKAISGSLINAMKGIEWDEVYAKASGFGSGLAKFLNGLFEGQKGTTLFGETGRLIANSLNTVLHGLDSFGTTFNWKQFGNSIADGINKFFQNFDFALLAKTLNSWAQGAFDTVTTALSKISWKDVWNGAKEFLSNLDVKTVGIIIGALTIKKILGLHLAKTALGIIGTSISKAIAGSLASRLGVEIAANEGISTVLSTALSKKIGGAFATLGTTVSAGVKALFGSGAAESALSFISPVAKAITGIGSVAIGAFTAISNFVTMLKNGFSWLNEALMLVGVTITAVGAVILGVAAAPAAITAGIVAGVATAAVVVKDHWEEIKGIFSKAGDWFKSKVIEPIKKNFELLKSAVSTAFNVLWTTVKSVWAVVSGWFKEHVTTPIKNAFSKMKKSVAGIFSKLWNSVKSGVAGAMNTVISRIETAINSLIGGVNTVLRGFNSVVSAAAKVAKVKWSGVDLVPKVSLPKVKAYATGGFMDKYSIATVGENGLPEIMGTVGGKPAVAGSQEITGIKDAINSTSAQEVSLLRQQNQLLQAILQKNFGITTNDIGKAARDYGREHYNRTGDNVYVF